MALPTTERPVALITGASAGIGLAIARTLAVRGWSLVLIARDPARLARAAETVAGCFPHDSSAAVLIHPVDLTMPDAAGGGVAIAHERFGRLDALINNAGVAPLLPIPDTSDEAIDECIAMNLRSPLIAIRAAWPILARTASMPGAPAHGTAVVNISTMGTADPFPGFFAYAATKAGVNLAARSVAKEGAASRIRGFAIAPAAVETAMLRALFPVERLPPDACLSADDVAALVLDCIEGRRPDDNGRTLFIRRDGSGVRIDAAGAG